MILMHWIRNDDGGFTAFQVQVSRAKLTHFVWGQLVAGMRSIYCREQTTLALYQGLAQRAKNPVWRDGFLRLAQAETHQLERRAEMLKRLNASIPRCCGGLARLRQRVLIWLGPRCALVWIKHIKRDNIRRQIALARLLQALIECP